MVINSGGLGDMYKVDGSGNVVDCDSFNNFFVPQCWNPLAPTVQATTSTATVTNPDGSTSTSTVLVPATPANTNLTTPSFFCNFLDCDASGNLQLDGTNLLWLGGATIGLLVLLKSLKLL